MLIETDRLPTLERVLTELRLAERMLEVPLDPAAWRGPARDAFDSAAQQLPALLRAAAAALERERMRSVLAAERASWQAPTS